MTRLESASTIEARVGARRHATDHLARAVSAEQRVYILHPEVCVASGIDLRECEFSEALDLGIDQQAWEGFEDSPVVVGIDDEYGELVPTRRSEA